MKKHILYFHHSSDIGGATWSLLQIVNHFRATNRITVVLSTPGLLVDELRKLDVEVLVQPGFRSIGTLLATFGARNPGNAVRELLAIGKGVRIAETVCARYRPDVVHINASVLCHLAKGAKRAGVPCVVLHVREPSHLGRWEPMWRVRRHLLQRYVDTVVSITREDAAAFDRADRAVVVHNWPDFTGRDGLLNLEQQLGLTQGRRVLLVMGGRDPRKGTLTALKAVDFMKSDSFTILVLGVRSPRATWKGWVRDTLARVGVRTYGTRVFDLARARADKVILAPHILQAKAVIERAVGVVCPFECSHFAKPAIEAASLARPVVISDGPHAREAVIDGQTGFLVPPGDPRALAMAMDRLLANPEEAAAMGERARVFVTRQFDRAESLRRLEAVYEGRPVPPLAESTT